MDIKKTKEYWQQGQSLKEAQDYLSENKAVGTRCPCCSQHVKYYKRNFTKSHAEYLEKLYLLSNGKWGQYFHASEIVKGKSKTGTAELSKLAYWGLIEQQVNRDTQKRTSGMWRITHRGLRFAEGDISIPKYILTFKARVQKESEEEISIGQAFGRFDYRITMGIGEL